MGSIAGSRWLPRRAGRHGAALALNNNHAAKTYQQALFEQNQPAVMFFTSDVQADYDRMKGSR